MGVRRGSARAGWLPSVLPAEHPSPLHAHPVELGLERVHVALELVRSGAGLRDEGLTANRLCGNRRSFERVNPALAGTNPMDTVFCEPVLARLPGKDGLSELIEIRTVRDGLSALNRCGMGGDHLAPLRFCRPSVTRARTGPIKPAQPF